VQPGTRIGTYEVIGLLGAGGMGEVYRARDSRLNRQVALKILPALFAVDPERLARFNREAQVLASLNHPNIATIHGVEHADGSDALVLELVEGPTLAERIAGGPLPLDQVLSIARQVAEALAAAHEHGVVHRDLKPANIKVRPDGSVKVLDFGLAKALDSAPGTVDASQSPTLGVGSARGVILGTAAYMAPEQARGQAVDKRADIWAFGCILYEMLTGRQAFPGDSVSDSIASILTKEPDWDALPAATPSRLRRLLRRCLEKNPRERLHDMNDVRLEVADALQPELGVDGRASRPSASASWRLAVAIVAAALLGAALTAAVASLISEERVPAVTRLSIGLSGPQALVVGGLDRDFALSPDGTRLVYIGANGSQLFVRRMDSLDATPLGGLAAPRGLFISPDGAWVGFFDGVGTLRKIAVTGGPAVTLCQSCGTGPRGSTWGPNDTIVMATTDPTSGLLGLSAAGGQPDVLTRPNHEQGERDQTRRVESLIETPSSELNGEISPDGRWLAYESNESGRSEIYVRPFPNVASGRWQVSSGGGTRALWARNGQELFYVTLTGTLMSIRPEAGITWTAGPPAKLFEGPYYVGGGGAAGRTYDVAPDGRFLMIKPAGTPDQVAATVIVVQNWTEELKRLVPVD
jgi:serine/threonine-protein kinase